MKRGRVIHDMTITSVGLTEHGLGVAGVVKQSRCMAQSCYAPIERVVGFVTDAEGRLMTAYEIRGAFDAAIAKGYQVVPPCDNFDEKTGHCKGHPQEEKPCETPT